MVENAAIIAEQPRNKESELVVDTIIKQCTC